MMNSSNELNLRSKPSELFDDAMLNDIDFSAIVQKTVQKYTGLPRLNEILGLFRTLSYLKAEMGELMSEIVSEVVSELESEVVNIYIRT